MDTENLDQDLAAKKLRRRNLAVGFSVVALFVLIYAISIVRMSVN